MPKIWDMSKKPAPFPRLRFYAVPIANWNSIEKCLHHDDIPCVIHGRDDFLDTDEVRGVLAFFRSLQIPCDTAALETAAAPAMELPC